MYCLFHSHIRISIINAASTVMLVSVVQFYLGEENTYKEAIRSYNSTRWPERQFFQTINGPVYVWKLWACIGAATAGVLMFLIILLMHFDTICFPRLWFQVFRDGSLAERNILIGMLAFWCVALHINTSSLSVGEAQANVFFTTWIVFVCTILNLGVWRQSANLPRLAVKVVAHHRETTYNWCWTLIFVLITAGAGTDMYFHRDDVTFRYDGEVVKLDNGMYDVCCCVMLVLVLVVHNLRVSDILGRLLSTGDWTRILVMLWSEVALVYVGPGIQPRLVQNLPRSTSPGAVVSYSTGDSWKGY